MACVLNYLNRNEKKFIQWYFFEVKVTRFLDGRCTHKKPWSTYISHKFELDKKEHAFSLFVLFDNWAIFGLCFELGSSSLSVYCAMLGSVFQSVVHNKVFV